MQVNIVIQSTKVGTTTKINTTISHVNPDVTNAKLLELANALNAFTTNSYVKTSKETTEDL